MQPSDETERSGGATAYWHGVYFPVGYTVAVVDDLDVARFAVEQLIGTGFAPADVQLVSGREALRMHRRRRRHANLLDKLVGALPTDERSIQDEYLMQAEEGSSFVVFRSHGKDQETRARRILAEHGAHGMRHYGRWTWDDLT